jgi:hypothetical protein
MRKYVTIAFFIFLFKSLQGQQIDHFNDPYYECLKIYVGSLKGMDVVDEGDTIMVSQRDYISNYEGSYEGVYIKMLPNDLLHKLTKKGRAVRVIVINPLEFKNGDPMISIVNFGATRKKQHYSLINNGHNVIKLTFNCEDGEYNYEIVDSH